ncbi:MAG TPA: hypothetical protein V6D06_06765 [Trichocoleus sp.]
MDKRAFKSRYREQVRDILTQLQSAMVVSAQLEVALANIGQSVQALSRDVEEFLSEESDQPPSAS